MSLLAAILLGTAGHIALQSAAEISRSLRVAESPPLKLGSGEKTSNFGDYPIYRFV
jgi:hypothetical protein